ncbi:anhydro-N-acetylmuramic acid kinase [Taylorella equigenitalis]|uniref:anhydro-N-acetylmuramic acid kinase n=2 Tax=Taylorella equigenitalis TaxID=29575 RepID=UPI00041E77FA|nr:anhydro-N-acetylmuramic acid kinase [Taylorella equigenitalis]ASY38304.1 anhydro-N-acetylmuramic acid kinase [Taylorella equigenitalis]KGK33972.1 anhydro-N-acetylmuramic acid kinase [Taylorella equigenitalis]WDU46193.1 anhydro-N-acetylmuramic acid kinase [Taylorella equigenitalis]WDU51659.1 anhydro-N-acetylmuramic acid kinase [Taylorella equigenitalis]
MAMREYFIGLMSGTSTDGVDAVLCTICETEKIKILGHEYLEFNDDLRSRILNLNEPAFDEITESQLVSVELAKISAQCIANLLLKLNLKPTHIKAIGAHGQTIRHDPKAGYSLQLNNPSLLSELAQIDVVADFRNADISVGGQGAPLVPAFHSYLFESHMPTAILNLGGFANISILNGNDIFGYDIGPCNALMDLWINTHKGENYDDSGKWGASGHCHEVLLEKLLSYKYFSMPAPKSTGRDEFNLAWLMKYLEEVGEIEAVNVMSTLREMVVSTIHKSVSELSSEIKIIYVCGGGVYNQALMSGLNRKSERRFISVQEIGVDPMTVEAMAFAWLAYMNLNKKPLNLTKITGAKRPKILGAYYPH